MDDSIKSMIAETVAEDPTIKGIILANRQGLPIESHGQSDSQSAGILVAISDLAAQLQPGCNPPTVILDYGDKKYFIQKYGITGAILKTNTT